MKLKQPFGMIVVCLGILVTNSIFAQNYQDFQHIQPAITSHASIEKYPENMLVKSGFSIKSLKGKTIVVQKPNFKTGILEEKLVEFKQEYPSDVDFFTDYFLTLQKHTNGLYSLARIDSANVSPLSQDSSKLNDYSLSFQNFYIHFSGIHTKDDVPKQCQTISADVVLQDNKGNSLLNFTQSAEFCDLDDHKTTYKKMNNIHAEAISQFLNGNTKLLSKSEVYSAKGFYIGAHLEMTGILSQYNNDLISAIDTIYGDNKSISFGGINLFYYYTTSSGIALRQSWGSLSFSKKGYENLYLYSFKKTNLGYLHAFALSKIFYFEIGGGAQYIISNLHKDFINDMTYEINPPTESGAGFYWEFNIMLTYRSSAFLKLGYLGSKQFTKTSNNIKNSMLMHAPATISIGYHF